MPLSLTFVLLFAAACDQGKTAPPASANKGSPPTGRAAPGANATPGRGTNAPARGRVNVPPPAPDEDLPSDGVIARMLAPWKGDLDGLEERRYLRVLVTFSKTNYFIDRAQQKGLTYDAGKLFETFLNERVRPKNNRIHIVFIPVSRERILKDLADGRGDIAAANFTITSERQGLVDFSAPVLEGVREVLVTGKEQPPAKSVEDLADREVHVRRSSSYFNSLTELNQRLRASSKPAIKIVEAPEQLEDEDLIEMVNADLIPATVVDNHIAEFWQQVFDDFRVEPVEIKSGSQIAWAVRKDTPKLQEVVNAFVRANPKGSKNFNMLYQKYLKNAAYVKNAAAASERAKFQRIRAFFEKYGGQYDVPWLLLAAQGYQESQLDQSRKSHVGAVGVMQIKPTTAAGNPINITGVESSEEKNIEAGAKYLRFIVNQYFKDEPMDRLNKGLFAMASYNAGPARVSGLRKKAAAMGLDQNKWFANVEVVAAREIGSETVTYVSNIYKYYVSYDLFSRQSEARRRVRSQ